MVLIVSSILASSLLYLLNLTVVNASLAGILHFSGYINCCINVSYFKEGWSYHIQEVSEGHNMKMKLTIDTIMYRLDLLVKRLTKFCIQTGLITRHVALISR